MIRAEELVHQGLKVREITGILSSEGIGAGRASNFAGLRRRLSDFRHRKKEG
jgi:hypothetical protein